MSDTAERAEFEAWATRVGLDIDCDSDTKHHYYYAATTQIGWMAWQERARRASTSAGSAWTIEWDNYAGPDGDGYAEWWTVSDGARSFRADTAADAEWLRAMLSAAPAPNGEKNGPAADPLPRAEGKP